MSEQLKPKVVTAFLYLPKKSFYLLNLEIRRRPSDVVAVSTALADSRIEIICGTFSLGLMGNPGTWQIFVEPQDVGTTPEMIRRLLLSLPGVVSCQIKQSKDGLLVDELTFPIVTSSGERAMILRNDIFNGMLQATRNRFGSGGDLIIYDQGVSAGRISGKELLAAMGKEKIGEHIDQVVGMYQSLGWGIAKLVKFNLSPLELNIRMFDSAECSGQKSAKPVSHFMRGHLAGVVDGIFGTEPRCTETNCLAVGDKYCEYKLEAKR